MPIIMDKDGQVRPFQVSDLKEVAERDERIRQLEKLNATLAAEVDRMRPVIERVNYVVLSGGAPARLIELDEAFAMYKAGGIYEASREGADGT